MKKLGFTIIEALVIVLLISIVMGVAVAPYIAQKDLFQKQLARTKLQDGLSLVMLYITKDAYTSKGMTINTVGSISTVALTRQPALGAADEVITYTVTGGNLTRTVAGNTITITGNITRFLATNPTANYLTVSLVGQDANQTITLDTGIALRATHP